MVDAAYYQTEVGILRIGVMDGKIRSIELENDYKGNLPGGQQTECSKQAVMQIEEYFEGKRKQFQLPLDLRGTEFCEKVWACLLEIPYGETRSYKDIAIAVGNEKATRAVGMANHRNPIMIVVPCHRVIGTNGTLVGYAGGLEVKKKLLNTEGICCD